MKSKKRNIDALNSSFLNIDEINPSFSLLHKKTVFLRANTGGTIGIDESKMLNWRALERRRWDLYMMSLKANKKFWDLLKSIGGKKKITKIIKVDEDWVYIVNSDSYRYERASLVVEQLLRNSKDAKEFFFVSQEDGGSEVAHADHKSRRLIDAFLVYDRAFKEAVSCRLRSHIDANFPRLERTFESQVQKLFLVKNCGRIHSFALKSDSRIEYLCDSVVEC